MEQASLPTGIRDLLDQNPIVGEQKRGARRIWTNKEVATLRATFPTGGVRACLSLLPGRSATSIYQRAAAENLRAPKGKAGASRQRWSGSPQIDAVIRRVYQSTPTKGDIKKLAVTLGRPLWWVCKRAAQLGLSTPRFRELPWSEAELEFVAGNSHKPADALSRMLKHRGFNRTATAITVRLKRLGTPTGKNADIDHYTANQLSKLFGNDRGQVMAWIVKGWLVAERRGTARTSAQGGDEYWIHRQAIRKFVIENTGAFDIRKVEKFWFVEMLTQPAAASKTAHHKPALEPCRRPAP